MRSFIFLSIFAFAIVRADWSIVPTPEKHETLDIPRYVPEVTVIEEHRDYVVKLDCVGCPLDAIGRDGGHHWMPEQDSALVLHFTMEKTNGLDSTLMLNGRRIMPLDPLPLEITTWQVWANLTTDAQSQLLLSSPSTQTIPITMAFEHTMLRTQEGAERMIQFDVTGLVAEDKKEPFKLNGQGQKLVQIQLQVNKETREVAIGDLQVVERQHRAQPFTMKCGRLAMAKTSFDPSEWDTYGKIGSWSRMFSKTFSFLDLQQNPLLLPVAVMLGLVAFIARRMFQQGEQEVRFADDDEANVALLDIDFDDLPPAYANIPIFKIEEYD